MQKREFKDNVYEQLARVGKALASPKRFEMLDLLTQGERTVEQLAGETGATVANASQHLQVLRAAQLVESRKAGQHVYYRAAGAAVGAYLVSLRALAVAQLAELRDVEARFHAEQGSIESIDSDTLRKRLRSGRVVLLDTRPENEFEAGHLPGAVNVPMERLPRFARELPKSKEIVAYCRGPYCVFATEAVKYLTTKGFRASRLRDGVAEWRARGFAVESAPAKGASQ